MNCLGKYFGIYDLNEIEEKLKEISQELETLKDLKSNEPADSSKSNKDIQEYLLSSLTVVEEEKKGYRLTKCWFILV